MVADSTYSDWQSAANGLASNATRRARCPSCGRRSVDGAFVTLSPVAGFATLMAWCARCLRGVHLSCIRIPASTPLRVISPCNVLEQVTIPNFLPVQAD